MNTTLRVRSAFGLVCIVLFGAPAAAQQRVEVAGGYSVAHYNENDRMLLGWFASIAAQPAARADWLVITSEVSGDYDTTSNMPRRRQPRTFAFLDGPRVTTSARVRAFGELLFGFVHDEGFVESSVSRNHFAWQPGAGIDVDLTDHVAARFQGTLRFLSEGTKSPAAARFLSAIVFGTKRRPSK